MDRGAWKTRIHDIARVGPNLAIKTTASPCLLVAAFYSVTFTIIIYNMLLFPFC